MVNVDDYFSHLKAVFMPLATLGKWIANAFIKAFDR